LNLVADIFMIVVAILAGYAPSLVNFRGQLIKDLISRQFCVYAIAPDMDGETASVLSDYGARPIKCGFNRVGLNPIRDVVDLFCLAKVLRSIECEVFLGYTIKPVVFGSLSAKIAGVKSIYALITGLGYSFFGNSAKQRLIGVVARRLYKVALKQCRGAIFQNRDDLLEFQSLSLIAGRRVTVVNGSGVDLNWFRVAQFPAAETRFLMIARLYKEKGVLEYLAAAEVIKAIYPEVKIRLVGRIDGNPNSIDKKLLKKFIGGGVIEYFEESHDVREHISDSTVLVHPSYREGVPRVVLEAMAMGRPVITTDAPGCRETVEHGLNGFLVNVRDSNGLVKYMRKFIHEPEIVLSMGNVSRKMVEKKFDVHHVNQAMIKFLEL
jgi:glycosyltransferase involved in cell wall biosynthesis